MPKKEKRRYILFWFFVGPAIILRVTTSVYPILKTFYFSVLDYDLLKRTKDYIGLENYLHLFNDVTIREITGFTLLFIISSVCLQLLLGMIVAHLLNANFKGKKLVRTINLIPWVIPVVVAGYAFRWMLDTDYGLVVDWIRRLIGLKPDLLENAVLAKLSLILVNVWKNTPFMALVLLAGFQSIPEELYESAMIDGANKFQRFLAITLPASSATVVTLGLFNIIWQISNIDLILGLTHGGPGSATVVIAYRIFQTGMLWFKWGLSSALSVILIFVVALIGLIGLRLFRRYEFSL